MSELIQTLNRLKKLVITEALLECYGNVSLCARKNGIPRETLRRWMKELDIKINTPRHIKEDFEIINIKDHLHGTATGYQTFGCRCDRCTLWKKGYNLRRHNANHSRATRRVETGYPVSISNDQVSQQPYAGPSGSD